MTALRNPATGHEINADKDSLEFWKAAGYREAASTAKKAPAKKASSSKTSK